MTPEQALQYVAENGGRVEFGTHPTLKTPLVQIYHCGSFTDWVRDPSCWAVTHTQVFVRLAERIHKLREESTSVVEEDKQGGRNAAKPSKRG